LPFSETHRIFSSVWQMVSANRDALTDVGIQWLNLVSSIRSDCRHSNSRIESVNYIKNSIPPNSNHWHYSRVSVPKSWGIILRTRLMSSICFRWSQIVQ
jgi:hypothetical protein